MQQLKSELYMTLERWDTYTAVVLLPFWSQFIIQCSKMEYNILIAASASILEYLLSWVSQEELIPITGWPVTGISSLHFLMIRADPDPKTSCSILKYRTVANVQKCSNTNVIQHCQNSLDLLHTTVLWAWLMKLARFILFWKEYNSRSPNFWSSSLPVINFGK